MPSKLEKFYFDRFSVWLWFVGLCFYSFPVFATLTVKPVEPYQVNSDVVCYASTAGAQILDTGAGFRDFNFSTRMSDENPPNARSNMLKFVVSSDKFKTSDSGIVVMVFVKLNNSATKEIPITFAGTGDCEGQCEVLKENLGAAPTLFNAYFAAEYNANNSLTIGFYLKNMCEAINTGGSVTAEGCTASVFNSPGVSAVTTVTLTFKIGTLKSEAPVEFDSTKTFDEKILTLKVQGGASALSCPDRTDIYLPGDGEISFSAGKFSKTPSTDFSPINTVMVIGKKGGDPVTTDPFNTSTSDFVARLLIDSGGQSITGFTNTTDGLDNSYNLYMSVRDTAGVVAPFTSGCKLTGVQTSAISGFLQKSNCFIATAAFRDAEAAPVQLLREFRDQILLKFSLGKKFVHFYYRHSPPLANWLVKHPVFRIPVLHALLPLEIYAWLILNPLFQGSVAHAEEPSKQPYGQPYIDQLNEKLPAAEQSESFIDSVRSKMKRDGVRQGNTSQGYSEKMRQRILEESRELPVESYTEQERIKLKPESGETEGAIAAFQEGRSTLKAKKTGKIKGVFGMKLAASAKREITGTNGAASQTFSSVYGTDWVPDLGFTYEYQPFHWEWFGNFGLVGGAGLAFQGANGKFQIIPQKPVEMGVGSFGSVSQTKLSFYTVPVMLGLNFRLNLLRFLKPYVQASPTAIFFMETRSDSREGNKGYSRGLQLSGGVNLLMDWMFPDLAWNVYEELGFHHSYLTLDYTKLSTLGGDVRFSNSSYSAGMTYEF